MDVTRGVGFVEPLEHRLSLTEAGVHERHRIRRHVPLAGVGFQPSQHFSRFVGPPGLRKNVAPERDRLAVAAREPRRVPERFQREIGLTRLLVRLSELHVSDPELRVHENGPPRVFDCGGILASLECDLGGQRVTQRLQWLELAHAAHGWLCFAVPTGLREGVPQESMRRRIAGIEVNRQSECRLRGPPVPVQQPVHLTCG